MKKSFREALAERRSYYELSAHSPLDDRAVEEILHFAVKSVPSAFNSQSTRMVLLVRDAHRKLWDIVLQTLRGIVPASAIDKTALKIDTSFASGHGTVLFYEDMNVVEGLKRRFPTYADNFCVWSDQTSAMHQLAVWTMLEEAGFGASLQHYNPLIDKEVRETWNLPEHWRLIAQMPFGTALDTPDEKEFLPLESRVFTFCM